MKKRSPAEKFNLKLRMIHGIGRRKYLRKMDYCTGKEEIFKNIKKKDGEATFAELHGYLNKIMNWIIPSERTLKSYLSELIKEGYVNSTGQRWGKEAIYSLTDKGKELQADFDRYNAYFQGFVKKYYKVTPLLLGYHDKTPTGKKILDTYMTIHNPEEIQLILKALDFMAKKTGDHWVFMNECAKAQKLGLLWYCRTLVDPRFIGVKERFSVENLLQNKSSLSDFFKELIEFIETT
jgi:DNA-binding PadR family transcriptional regulator